jgi:hypothetical protein
MTPQYEPAVVAPIPPEIIALASKNANVVINWRLDEWPIDVKEQLRSDPEWRKSVGPNHGLLVSPMLTDFILDVKAGSLIAVLSQDSFGSLALQIGTLFAILPVTRGKRIDYGVNATLLFSNQVHEGTTTLASYVLAITSLETSARVAVYKDDAKGRFMSVVS